MIEKKEKNKTLQIYMLLTFFTPRIFLDLFFLSFICFLDFSTLVSSPFCHQPANSVQEREKFEKHVPEEIHDK